MLALAQRQRLQPLQEQERVERAEAAPMSRSSCTRALMMNATLPRPGKLPNTSQNFRPW